LTFWAEVCAEVKSTGQFLAKTSIYDKNWDFEEKILFLTKTLIFDENLDL